MRRSRTVAGLADELRRQLPARKSGAPVGPLERYLGSPVPVRGVSVPELTALARRFGREHAGMTPTDRRGLAAQLWRGRTFEERVLAVMLLARARAWEDPRSWRMIRGWPDRATGWGLSDTLAMSLVAPAVASGPGRFREVVAWTRSPNPWRRRASLYAIGPLVRRGDLDRPFQVIDRLAGDPERWVQRAVGTWLRECWKRDPARTERYLHRNVGRLSAIALTVATERAPRATRAALRAEANGPNRRRRARLR